MSALPLTGLRALNLSINLPGPVAAARLQALGATVVKVEPPGGDLLAQVVPAWYQELCAGQQVLPLDLKSAEGQRRLEELLAESDLLLSAFRPLALERLGLGWECVHTRHPRLCYVVILGYPPPDENRSGHDLNYQAELGLLDLPHMPRTLLADFAGAERAVNAALALLLARQRGQGAGYAQVSLYEAGGLYAQALRYGLTVPGGPLGGGLERYRLYQAKGGWIAVAALEPHFWEKLLRELGLEVEAADHEALERAFLAQTAQFWHEWGRVHDLPVSAVTEI